MGLSVDGYFYVFQKKGRHLCFCATGRLDIEGHYWLPQKKHVARKTIGTF